MESLVCKEKKKNSLCLWLDARSPTGEAHVSLFHATGPSLGVIDDTVVVLAARLLLLL